ncbi:hypothetical protein [Longispora urticae]
MDLGELAVALGEAGLPESGYWIVGGALHVGASDASLCLKRGEDGRWVQGIHERGVFRPDEYFDSEEEACQHTYDRVVRGARMFGEIA